ncbi:MAG: hypothetical protein GXP03_11540 [Alphaproteobacteria bacterium]|nr:hypothetical protein [Alphaproteobacteria bacterium]
MRRFGRSEDGSLIIFSLFLLVLMLMIAGMAVDLMRTEMNRARLQSTLDRAILAGASLNQTLDAQDVVLDYFAKAGFADYITAGDIIVVESATGKSVTAGLSIDVTSYFMNLMGITSLAAPASGTAIESVTDVEISLVVDTSGSMGGTSSSGNSKMDDLKAAAKEFVYLMQCDPDASPPFDGVCTVEADKVSVSLVPYNEQVLLGENLIQQFNTTEEHTQSSCIDFDVTDYASIPVELDPQVINPLALPDLNPSLRRSATIDPWGSADNAVDWRRTCSPYAERAVSAYENDYQDLEVAIDAMYASGYTSIELGMKWGSALLDPAFRPGVENLANGLGVVSTNFVGRPFDYSTPNTKKVVVLMTDGKNTTQHIVREGFRDGPSPFYQNLDTGSHADHVSVYDAVNDDYFWVEHGTRDAAPEGGTNVVQMTYPEFWDTYTWDYYETVAGNASLVQAVDQVFNAEKDVRLEAMCNSAKAQGIEVYTMGFETSAASSLVMQSCASTPSHYYDVDGTDISEAFQSIARNINSLRLTN